jgi:hypothetical protein
MQIVTLLEARPRPRRRPRPMLPRRDGRAAAPARGGLPAHGTHLLKRLPAMNQTPSSASYSFLIPSSRCRTAATTGEPERQEQKGAAGAEASAQVPMATRRAAEGPRPASPRPPCCSLRPAKLRPC